MTNKTRKTIQKLKSKANIKNTLDYVIFYSHLYLQPFNELDMIEIRAINHMLQLIYSVKNCCKSNGFTINNIFMFYSLCEHIRTHGSIDISDTHKLTTDEINFQLLYTFMSHNVATFDNIVKEFNKLPDDIITKA